MAMTCDHEIENVLYREIIERFCDANKKMCNLELLHTKSITNK